MYGGVERHRVEFLRSLSLRELGHGLGAFRHGMLGQLTGKNQADGGLHGPAAQGLGLVHPAKLSGLVGNLVKGIRHKVVHNGNTFLRDASLRVNLLEHLEDVALEGLRIAALALHHGGLGNLLHHGE